VEQPEVAKDRELADLGSRLALLNEELYQLPSDDFAARIEVRDRIREVRAEVARVRNRPTPENRHALQAELHQLEKQWDALAADRIDVVRQAGGGSMGGDFGFAADAMHINREIDASTGRAELEARIVRLRERLKALDEET
jgi:hypothetical protein